MAWSIALNFASRNHSAQTLETLWPDQSIRVFQSQPIQSQPIQSQPIQSQSIQSQPMGENRSS